MIYASVKMKCDEKIKIKILHLHLFICESYQMRSLIAIICIIFFTLLLLLLATDLIFRYFPRWKILRIKLSCFCWFFFFIPFHRNSIWQMKKLNFIFTFFIKIICVVFLSLINKSFFSVLYKLHFQYKSATRSWTVIDNGNICRNRH